LGQEKRNRNSRILVGAMVTEKNKQNSIQIRA